MPLTVSGADDRATISRPACFLQRLRRVLGQPVTRERRRKWSVRPVVAQDGGTLGRLPSEAQRRMEVDGQRSCSRARDADEPAVLQGPQRPAGRAPVMPESGGDVAHVPAQLVLIAAGRDEEEEHPKVNRAQSGITLESPPLSTQEHQ